MSESDEEVTEQDKEEKFKFTMTEEEFEALGREKVNPSSHLFPPKNEEIEEMKELYLRACRSLETVPSQRILSSLELKSLCLRHRGLGDVGITALVSSIKTSRIRSLDLNGNFLTKDGMASLCGFLVSRNNLTYLDLSNNFLQRKGGLIVAEMLHENRSLESLVLSGNQLDDAVGIALAEALHEHPYLEYLDISQNKFGDSTGMAFEHVLLNNYQLTELNMNRNCIRGEGATALLGALRTNNSLKKLHFSGNGVGLVGSRTLGEALSLNYALKELDISETRIPLNGAIALAAGLSINYTLEILKIGKNPIQTEGLKIILTALAKNANTKLKLLDCHSLILSPDLHIQLDDLIHHHRGVTVTFEPRGLIFKAAERQQGEFNHHVEAVEEQGEEHESETESFDMGREEVETLLQKEAQKEKKNRLN